MKSPIKFGAGEFISDDTGRDEFTYPNIWARQRTTGPDRLIIGTSGGQINLMVELMRTMNQPFLLLYVLLVSRCGQESGRYETVEPIERREAETFLLEFKDFFEQDARHHLWVMSADNQDLLVYDHHNVIYAYGNRARFEATLRASGLTEAENIGFPVPHAHYYNEEFDEAETKLIKYWDWERTKLRPGDDE